MPFFKVIEQSEKTDEVFKKATERLGRVPNMLASMAHAPIVAEIYLSIAALLSRGVLSAQVRESLATEVARANQCEYCFRVHAGRAKKAGISFASLTNPDLDQVLEPKLKILLAFANETVLKRGQNKEFTLESLAKAGWTNEEISEAIAIVTLNLFPNYFNHLNETVVDFPEFIA